jgi:hypothetical protein
MLLDFLRKTHAIPLVSLACISLLVALNSPIDNASIDLRFPSNCASFSENLATSKLQKDEHDRLMSKKEDVVLEAVTEYAKNPDTYDANIEGFKAQPDIGV